MGNKQQLQVNNAKLSESLEEIESLPQKHIWTGDTMIMPGEESITIPAYADKELTIEAIASNFFDLTKFGYTKAAAGTVTYAESGSTEINIIHHLGTPIKLLFMELLEEVTYTQDTDKWLTLMLSETKNSKSGRVYQFLGGGQIRENLSSPNSVFYNGFAAESSSQPEVQELKNEGNQFLAATYKSKSYPVFETATYRWLVLA